jgi:hypothetical protein
MSERGVTPGFADRVIRVRTEVRPRGFSAALTAAALAAPVWADEGLAAAEDGLSEAALRRCGSVAGLVSLRDRLDEVSTILDPVRGICAHPQERQAVALGLVTRSDARSRPLHDWAAGLLMSSEWQRQVELAPAVLRGLLMANLTTVLESLCTSLRAAVEMRWTDVCWPAPVPWRAGAIRSDAIEYSRNVLSHYNHAGHAAYALRSQAGASEDAPLPDLQAVVVMLGGRHPASKAALVTGQVLP